MVNLSKEQQTALTALGDARRTYDEQEARLTAEVEAARESIKRPIREAVARAESLGIPTRRIHLALGLGQVAQLYTFLRPPKGSATAGGALLGSIPAEPERPKVGDFTITAGDMDEADPWFVTDEYGKKYSFHYLIGHGTPDAPHLFNQSELDELPKEHWQELTTAIGAAWGSIAWE